MAKGNAESTPPIYTSNIFWEITLTDSEKIILHDIQYKCRLSKEASTESNTTIGLRCSKSPDSINRIIGSLEKKGWITRLKDYSEQTQRRIVLTDQSISMLNKPYLKWYVERIGKFAYPPITKAELISRIGRNEFDRYEAKLVENGWIINDLAE